MKEEKEVKLEIVDKDLTLNQIKNKLEKTYNIKFNELQVQKDVYYDTPELKFFNLNHCLRIRTKFIDTKEHNIFAYKALFYVPQRKSNPWFVLEKEFKLPTNTKQLKELSKISSLDFKINKDKILLNDIETKFKSLSIKKMITINKTRYKSKVKDFTICIDEVKNLGLFIEFEVKQTKILKRLIELMPINYKRIRFGYTNLYVKRVLKQNIIDLKSKYFENQNWNYLNKQKDIVTHIINKNE